MMRGWREVVEERKTGISTQIVLHPKHQKKNLDFTQRKHRKNTLSKQCNRAL
jgi:hypothetical protein